MRKKIIALTVAASIGLTGCNTMPQDGSLSKEQLGTMLGAAGGMLLGSQFGKGNGRLLMMAAGAMAGSMLGAKIGADLDEKDRQALAMSTQNVLLNAKDGQASSWSSSRTGATATITPVSTRTKTESMQMSRTAKVVSVDSLSIINAPYSVDKGSNIRRGPSTNFEKLGSLAAGTSFNALGETGEWVAIGRKGVVVGYVHSALVSPIEQEVAAEIDVLDLDADVLADSEAEFAVFDLDDPSLVQEEVAASTQCRTVDYQINSKAGTEQSQVEMCQGTDGVWELG